MRNFKYFDLNNNGSVDPQEFAKVIEKIGIVIPTKQDLMNLFNLYDTDHSGALDYKEFSAMIFNRPATAAGRGASPQKSSGPVDVNELVTRLRNKLAQRGARGIIGLGRQFRIMDDNNSRSLDIQEFSHAMKDYMLGFTDAEIKTLFHYFDLDGSGSIDYDEFIRALRGPMSQFRQKLVMQAFNKLDRDHSGVIDINDLKGWYSAKKNPEVLSGKKTEDQVLLEFLETFEAHHNTHNGTAPDHVVTKEEFLEYYNNISASIDNDQYFELMMNNSWHMNSGDKTYGKGWGSAAPAGGKSLQQSFGNQRVTQPNYQHNPYQTSASNYGSSPPRGSARGSVRGGNAGQHPAHGKPQNYSEQQLVDRFRAKLAARGGRGILGLQRQFRIFDDDESRDLDMQEFKKACKDFRMEFSDPDIERLFRIFDRDQSGRISYDEFLRGIRGEMNQFRQGLVKQAYNKLDRDHNGVITLSDIKQVYNAKKHPDVRSGKKTEDEVLMEFLDTFEQAYAVTHKGSNDDKVTWDEFLEYYNNVSMSIDNDEYFQLMMNSAWNLDGSRVTKHGWGGKY